MTRAVPQRSDSRIRHLGRMVLFSSDLLDEVERMSDHVMMIHEGRVVLDATLGGDLRGARRPRAERRGGA